MTTARYQLDTVKALVAAGLALLVITHHNGLTYKTGCLQPITVLIHNVQFSFSYTAYPLSILS